MPPSPALTAPGRPSPSLPPRAPTSPPSLAEALLRLRPSPPTRATQRPSPAPHHRHVASRTAARDPILEPLLLTAGRFLARRPVASRARRRRISTAPGRRRLRIGVKGAGRQGAGLPFFSTAPRFPIFVLKVQCDVLSKFSTKKIRQLAHQGALRGAVHTRQW